MNIPLITCHYCGNVIHRTDLVHPTQVDKNTVHYYHSSCWRESQNTQADDEYHMTTFHDLGGYP